MERQAKYTTCHRACYLWPGHGHKCPAMPLWVLRTYSSVDCLFHYLICILLAGNRYLDGMRQAQFVGTLALLFGLLRAHPRHKDKLLLVWLGTSVFCCLSMGYAGLMLWVREGIFSASIFPWSMTGECQLFQFELSIACTLL